MGNDNYDQSKVKCSFGDKKIDRGVCKHYLIEDSFKPIFLQFGNENIELKIDTDNLEKLKLFFDKKGEK